MEKSVINRIKELCDGEIEFVSHEDYNVTLLFPYSNTEIEVEIDGDNEEEKIEDFISKVNQLLDDMIDHLEDCKL